MTKTFQRILIANRGEIACRIAKTARRIGISTVAVYSEADSRALHLSAADAAVCIGPAPAAESYLNIDRIVQACRDTNSDAVHPGYGFLSENAAFAEQLEIAGITFIGPSIGAIQRMGDKIAAKKIAQEAGVTTIPGLTRAMGNPDEAVTAAQELGFPIMLKAAAGGGGKGMRIARNTAECREGFERASSEARSAFGDERLFIEKYIEQPRHIEVQLLADKFNNVVHLGERECSLQRRHQKVIEETPSPFLTPATRAAMCDQAIALAKAVNYESAGTVEFIVDADRNFFFLEMNTRLQVEHPVTEVVTGLDLVELMIRIAAGEQLSLSQKDIRSGGWAIEARIYAEDPSRGFLPSVGRLVKFLPPAESDAVRIDSGVREGDEVSIHYDPMMAKLITCGPTREQAVAHLRQALSEFYVQGVSHNVHFLAALVEQARFGEGQFTTNTIAEEYPDGFQSSEVVHCDPVLLVVVAASIHRRYMDRAAGISGQLPGYERRVEDQWIVVLGGEHHVVEVRATADGGYQVTHAGISSLIQSDWRCGQPLFHGSVNGSDVCLQFERHNMHYRLRHRGCEIDIMVLTERASQLLSCMPTKKSSVSSNFLTSPMPGLLTQVLVGAGSRIAVGQNLAVVEAMKMENVLRAEREGEVEQVLAAVGDTLKVDQPILKFAGEAED